MGSSEHGGQSEANPLSISESNDLLLPTVGYPHFMHFLSWGGVKLRELHEILA